MFFDIKRPFFDNIKYDNKRRDTHSFDRIAKRVVVWVRGEYQQEAELSKLYFGQEETKKNK